MNMKKSEHRTTKRVAVGGKSDELYLITKFKELPLARQRDVLMLVDLFIDLDSRRKTRRRLKLVK